MPLAVGMRLGPYEILALIGSGGMGEVYRARDPRLGRDVAVKVLPESLTSDPDRLRRFEREARAVAALNHPNILTVHDVGTHLATADSSAAGTPYVVTELLEGETLAERLRKGALSLREAVETAVHVARGLAAAHAKTIAHRDLKPANVFLTVDGRVKILDFGLARWEGLGPEETTASVATDPGTRLGTVGYMSPEQVRGGRGDHRSDTFSFGVLLYEMVSGRHPFRRTTGVETQAAILREEPLALSGLGLPEALERVILRCLEKRPEDRFHSAHDLALALQSITGAALAPLPPPAAGLSEPGPYPGLRPFREEQRESFFGREAEVAALWEKLQRRKLLSLIGPSGVGKTSFVRAGLVPARPSGWRCVTATPGRRPFASLARALVPELASDTEALQELVGFDDPDVAVRLVGQWRRRHVGVLVVVDQLEELFTLNPPEVQAAFAELLRRLCDEADVHVLVSLRDDFLFACHAHPALAEVFTEVTPLGSLAAEALRRALVEPARKHCFHFEDEALVEEMCGAVEGERGALPLLAFCAAELWERRDRERRLLTRAACEEIGGVAGALAQHAEATLERIGVERQGIVREIFRNLVTAQGTRAACEWEELLSVSPDRRAAEEVLGALVDARLLTSYEEPTAEGRGEKERHRIEIVHESLLKAWPRLVRWLAQDEEGALLRDQLKQAAHLWDEKGRPTDLLWSGTAFREYELWRGRYQGKLTAFEEAFASAMIARARRRRRIRRAAVAAAFFGLSVVAIVVSVSRHQAVVARQRAEASKLLALGQVEIDRYPTAALAYTTKSLAIHDTPEGRLQALRILWKAPPARILSMPEGTQALNVAFSRDGRRLATTGFYPPGVAVFSEDGRLAQRLTQEQAKMQPSLPWTDFGGDAVFRWTWGDTVLAWTPDGRSFPAFDGPQWWVFGSDDGVLTISPPPPGASSPLLKQWSVSNGVTRLVRSLPLAPDEAPDPAFARLFRSVGPSLFMRPFPREEPGVPVLLGRHETDISSWEAPPGGERVLSVDRSGEWRIWSTAHRRMLARRRPPPAHSYSATPFDRTGSRIGWSSAEGSGTYVWALDDPPDAELLTLRPGEVSSDMGRPAFHPGGRWLAASSGYTTVSFWPLDLPHVRVLPGHTQGPISSLRFSPDSRYLVSCARDGMRIWPLVLGEGTQQKVELPPEYFCYGADVDSRGQTAGLAAVGKGLFVVTLATRAARRVLPQEPGTFFENCAFDATGRWLATVRVRTEDLADHTIRAVDLESGAARTWPYRERPGGKPREAVPLAFSWDGRLLLGGYGGVFSWSSAEDAPVALLDAPGRDAWTLKATPDGRWLAAVVGRLTQGALRDAEVVVLDLTKGTHTSVTSHGPDVFTAALDASARVLVTGDSAGTVRVGPISGGAPHLLVGHATRVTCVAVSPDGKWIASAAGSEIRLWPMPDVSKPPLHTLSHEDLLAKLQSPTNLKVVEDSSSASGYKLAIGAFPGWKDVPTW